MSEETSDASPSPRSSKGNDAARKIDAGGWGLFFIWVGVCLLVDPGWGVGLLGVGVITLGGQVVRKYFQLKVEGFWIVVGVLFLLAGILELYQVEFSLVPVVLILAGLALLVSIVKGKQKAEP